MNKVQDILNKLTSEELLLHEHLIEECLEREKEMDDNTLHTKESVHTLDVSMQKFFDSLEKLTAALLTLNRTNEEARESIQSNLLALMPDSAFFKA